MSRIDLSFAFAQARMQARFGGRPVTADWQQIEATRDLGALLQLLRGGPLERWTARLPARPGVHEIERRLREEWLHAVDEIVSWQPRHWREATRWMRWIVYLPSLQKFARGGRALAWMRADPVLGPIVARGPAERRTSLRGTALEPLQKGFTDTPDVTGAWSRQWERLWPRPRAQRTPLVRMLAMLRQTRTELAEAPPEASSRELLRTLEQRLTLVFRRFPLSPAASASFVGLMMLDQQRLRGALTVRSLRDAPVAPP
jgi:hypothetical protein